MFQNCRAFLLIGHVLRPASKLKQFFPFGGAKNDVRARSGAVEVFGNVELRLQRRLGVGGRSRSTLTTIRDELVHVVLLRSG